MTKISISLVAAGLVLTGCAEVNEAAPTATMPFTFLPAPTATPTVAAGQATVLPAPTPGPTATPVTYGVQEGDTLIGIAARFGVNLDELEALNPGVSPQVLQPGQVLVIPSGSEEAEGAFWPTSTPVPLSLSPVACYETPVGEHWCFLEARNPGPEPVENPSALVTLVGAGGEAVMSGVAYSPLNLIPAGGAVPLGVLFPPADAGHPPSTPITSAEAQLLSAEVISEPEARYLPVVIARTGVEATGRHRTVSGEIRLEGDRPARLVRLVLTLYNDAGRITGYRTLTLSEGLTPGDSVPFSLGSTSLAGRVASFSLAAEAQP